jgi:hypothetical protein
VAKVTTATTAVSAAEQLKDSTTGAATRSDGRRRTERVRREKPNYYDASAFIRKTRVNIFKYIHIMFFEPIFVSFVNL